SLGVGSRHMYDQAPETTIRQAQRMEAACARAGVPLAAAALQFSLRDPRITSTIVGFSRPARLAETVAFALQQIPEHLWEELDEIFYTKA
ncbi:MAG: aldo/keto reductase, partial [Ktedonobacteraceae bacterium]|nr:aldo/keto reductase [Ktedonobacteraceae bacterium]